MNRNKKVFANIAIIVFVVLAGTAGYFASNKPTIEPVTASASDDGSAWNQYSDASLAFEYPSIVSTKQKGETIALSHSIDNRHLDFCDAKGTAPELKKLTDLDVTLRVYNKNLKDTVQAQEGSDYVMKNFFKDNTFILSDGFIEKFYAGSMNGFQITTSVEGCGGYTYYFPISSTKTLVVERAIISDFQSINPLSQANLKLAGIIPPDQETEFFVKILSSVTVK